MWFEDVCTHFLPMFYHCEINLSAVYHLVVVGTSCIKCSFSAEETLVSSPISL